MSFTAEWLALREPVDAAARSVRLAQILGAWLTVRRGADAPPLRVIDLGAGTGANLRYAAPRIGTSQEWLLLDHDPALLCAAAAHLKSWLPGFPCRVELRGLDLVTQIGQLALDSGTLVTAAALLDLVSEPWLQALVGRAAAGGATVWFALSYDGRIECHPPEPEDAEVRELVNRHQLTDKGFGAALGPTAGRTARQLLAAQGYHVEWDRSDWQLGAGHLALQRALVTGWCEAALEAAPHRAAVLRGWLTRRRGHIEAARSQLRVGHVDIVGHP